MKEENSTWAEKTKTLEYITGLKVNSFQVDKQKGTTEIRCLQTGEKGVLEFTVTLKNNRCDYAPVFNQMIIGSLPDYLEEEIQFAEEQLPLFFWRIIDSLQNTTGED